jgi:menaquinone-dependent protoporphyrinogen oxidase
MQRRIGLFFASRHGQTRSIAVFLANRFAGRDVQVSLIDLTRNPADSPSLDDFDTVLIGAPLYLQRYPSSVRRFLRTSRNALVRHRSTGIFSVSLTAGGGRPGDYLASLGPLREMLADLAWTPHWMASFAGALKYREYNPVIRMVMHRISRHYGGPTDTTRDHELTRWDEVARFARHVAANQAISGYRSSAISMPTRTLDRLMPAYERRFVARRMVRGTPDDIGAAIEHMGPSDLQFLRSDRAVSIVPVSHTETREVASGMITDNGPCHVHPRALATEAAFCEFNEQGYTKVATTVWFDDAREKGTVVSLETRIHVATPDPRGHGRWYWRIVAPAIRLHMAIALWRIQRAVARLHGRSGQMPNGKPALYPATDSAVETPVPPRLVPENAHP